MNSIPFVVSLAIGWHASLFWLERSRKPSIGKTSLTKLLRIVEFDLLSTIRGELVRTLKDRPDLESRYDGRLQEINGQLDLLRRQDGS